jgi:hypothetical protein
MKNSQISVYILIGLLILIIVVIFSTQSFKDEGSNLIGDIVPENSRVSIDFFVNSCLESAARKTITNISYLYESDIQEAVQQYTSHCIDSFPAVIFDSIDYEVVHYSLLNKSLVFTLNYSVALPEDSYSATGLSVLSRETTTNISSISDHVILSSIDNRSFLNISEGVSLFISATLDPVDSISVLLEDARLHTLTNGDEIIGAFVYSFDPSGGEFSEPVPLRIYLDQTELAEIIADHGGDFESIRENGYISIADILDGSVRVYYDTTINVDEGYLEAYISSFSNKGAVSSGCKPCNYCYFTFKSYEGTWRVRLPTAVSRQTGGISVAGKHFSYRNQDKDCGCSRPSYTGRFSRSTFGGTHQIISGGTTFNLRTSGWQSCGYGTGSSSSSGGSSSSSGSSGSSTSASSPSGGSCTSWDYSKDQPCPSGRWNCDCRNHCKSRTAC